MNDADGHRERESLGQSQSVEILKAGPVMERELFLERERATLML